MLSIREKPVSLEEDVTIKETSEITTWCCCSQGTSALEAEFNKNVFMPNEKAEGEIKIDNSQCKVAVTRVRFSIIQELRQKIGHHHDTETKVIIQESCEGPGPEEGGWKKTLDIELDDIKYEVAEFKKKKGK